MVSFFVDHPLFGSLLRDLIVRYLVSMLSTADLEND
jgi:hypothetical protein